MAAWVAIIIGLLGQWGIIAYYVGRQSKALENVTDSVKNVDKRVDGHSRWIREVSERSNSYDGRIIRLEERTKETGR